MRDTGVGRLDTALPAEDQEKIQDILATYGQRGIEFHALRSRAAGSRRFIYFHVLVPGKWTVSKGHALCEEMERAIVDALPESTVFTHLQPKEEHVFVYDIDLDRHSIS